MRRTLAAAAVALLVGLALGWFFGRAHLERQWSNPVGVVTGGEHQRASVEGADPTPAEGARIVKARLPLKRMRAFLASYTGGDPVISRVGAVGRGDDGGELHLVVQNQGDCRVKSLSGVAYAYDAWGRAVPINKGGETYLAFATAEGIDPGGKAQLSFPLHQPGTASLAVAHVDEVVCDGGKAWKRP